MWSSSSVNKLKFLLPLIDFMSSSEIKVENLKWGDIQLICPCGGDAETGKNHFTLIQQGSQVVFKCVNKRCNNVFPNEVQIKIMQDIEKWLNKHDSLDGFVSVFYRTIIIPKKTSSGLDCYSKEKCKMQAKYIRTDTVGKRNPHKFYVIEVSNITIMNNGNLLNYEYSPV